MAFGLGKKSETRSSRPLSMMLPDNVKLFTKKTRNVLDRTLENVPASTERRRSRHSISTDQSPPSAAGHRNSAGSRHSMTFFSPSGYRSLSHSSTSVNAANTSVSSASAANISVSSDISNPNGANSSTYSSHNQNTNMNTTSSPAPALASTSIPPRKSSAAYMPTPRSSEAPEASRYTPSIRTASPAASATSLACAPPQDIPVSDGTPTAHTHAHPATTRTQASTPTINTHPRAFPEAAKKPEEPAPFLTLQLDSARDESLANLSKHYSILPTSLDESFDLSSSPVSSLAALAGAGPAMKLDSDLTPQGTPRLSEELERELPAEPNSAATEEFLFSDSGYANVSALSLGTRTLPSESGDDVTPTPGAQFDTEWTVKPRDTPVLYSLEPQFAAPDAGLTPENASTAPSSLQSLCELLVSPNRKVVLNRAIYIFDPATNGEDLSKMTLSEDDLFNPFEH